jgi:two-component system chemotaxis response regulator CheB
VTVNGDGNGHGTAHPVRDLVVVGASAGGVEALRRLVARLPHDLAAAVVVVLHIPASSRSALASILERAGPLPARQAQEGDRLERGRILVAPPDRHVIVADGQVTLSRGPHENGHRPAVDVLFRSAARAAGSRVVGVVLSGTLDDGTAGLVAIRERGGMCVVQDPDDATYAGMPQSAMEGDSPDAVLPVDEIAALLREVAGTRPPDDAQAPSPLMDMEVAMAVPEDDALSAAERPGVPSGFACPDCHGVLFEIDEGTLRRFRCRVGHAWSAHSLAAQQAAAVEGALWTALRALEEKAALSDRMARGAVERGHAMTASTFAEQALEARESAIALRDLIERTADLVPVPDPSVPETPMAAAGDASAAETAQALP